MLFSVAEVWQWLAVLPFDAEAAAGQLPVDVPVRAAEQATGALHAILERGDDLLPLPRVDAGRTERRAGPPPRGPTGRQANLLIFDGDMGPLIVLPAQREQLLLHLHRIALHPS